MTANMQLKPFALLTRTVISVTWLAYATQVPLPTRPAILEAQAHAETTYQNRIMYLVAIGMSIGNWHNIMLGIPGQIEPDV